MYHKSFDKALKENAQGIILMSLIINKDGYVVHGSILNEIHPELDDLVKKFIKYKFLPESGFNYKFRPFKINKKKVFCEIIIPFDFSILRYYKEPSKFHMSPTFFIPEIDFNPPNLKIN